MNFINFFIVFMLFYLISNASSSDLLSVQQQQQTQQQNNIKNVPKIYINDKLNKNLNIFINTNNTYNLNFNISDNLSNSKSGNLNKLKAILPSLTSTSVSGVIKNSTTATQQQSQVPLNQPIASISSSSSSLSSSSSGITGNMVEYPVLELKRALEAQLRDIRNNELGVTIIQEIFDSMEYVPTYRNDIDLSINISHKLEKKLNQSKRLLNDICKYIENDNIKINLRTIIHPCLNIQNNNNNNNNLSNSNNTINNNNSNDISTKSVDILKYLPNNVTNIIRSQILENNYYRLNNYNFIEKYLFEVKKEKSNFLANINFNKFFFVSLKNPKNSNCYNNNNNVDSNNNNNNNNNYSNDLNLNHKIFINLVKFKRILIVFDNNNYMNSDFFSGIKNLLKTFLKFLNADDFINIITYSNLNKLFVYNNCSDNSNFYNLNSNLNNLLNFIDNIDRIYVNALQYDLSRTFKLCFDMIANDMRDNASNKIQQNKIPYMILYVGHDYGGGGGSGDHSAPSNNNSENLSSLRDLIWSEQINLPYPVLVNAFHIIDDDFNDTSSPSSATKSRNSIFFTEMTQSNHMNKLNLTIKSHVYNFTGKVVKFSKNTLNSPTNVNNKFIRIFENFFNENFLVKGFYINLPKYDRNTNNLLITVTKLCSGYGIFGIDLYLSDLAEDITYYNRYKNSYSFLIDVQGMTIMHPSYPRPIIIKENYYFRDITYYETDCNFGEVKNEMLAKSSGNYTVKLLDYNANGYKFKTYSWSHASDNYIVIIASYSSDPSHQSINLKNLSPNVNYIQQSENINVLYHLDVHPTNMNMNTEALCKHFKQFATLDSGTIYLSATSFQSPFYHIKNNNYNSNRNTLLNYEKYYNISVQKIQPFLAYIKDSTRLLSNPGLQPEVRNDIAVLQKVMNFFKKKFLDDTNNEMKNYIIRRYITTINGVMQIYPGIMVNTDYEPTRRNWFRKAMEYPGKIIITEPYLDYGGAGYIVTISHTIFEGKANALHNNENDNPIGVVSIDLTHGWFYKVLLKSLGYCSEPNIRCFLMNDNGYLISHPSILTLFNSSYSNSFSSSYDSIQRQNEHITHKEKYVANDILNHQTLLKKKLCINYLNNTMQRYYHFNITINGAVFTNYIAGEKIKYQITNVPGTNIFVGIINSTNDGDTFCPCSRDNRLCFNCNRMEQTECECPCECPLYNDSSNFNVDDDDDDVDGGKSSDCYQRTRRSNSTLKYSICLADNEMLYPTYINSNDHDYDFDMKSCLQISCDQFTSQFDCLGVMGCEWCQIDVDGESLLSAPFCATQISCWNGVLGSMTPYGDGLIGPKIIDQIDPPVYSALGPVLGAIIALCLVVGFAMYCYKQNTDGSDTIEHLYIDSIQDNYGLPLSRLDYKDFCQNFDDPNDMNGMGNSKLLTNSGSNLNNIIISEISPYRISTNYRRPNGDSDHGYSTMTPHEDSEHISFNLVEPLIHNISNNSQPNQQRFSMSDSASINTSVSSPHNYHVNLIPIDRPKYNSPITCLDSMQTLLPLSLPSNHLEVAVDVHRQMEAT